MVSSYQTDQTSEVSDERATKSKRSAEVQDPTAPSRREWVFFLSRGAEMDARDELGGGDGFLL